MREYRFTMSQRFLLLCFPLLVTGLAAGQVPEKSEKATKPAEPPAVARPAEPPAAKPAAQAKSTMKTVTIEIGDKPSRGEAWLVDHGNNRKTRLRVAPGFDTFRIQNGKGETLLRGKVIRIEGRDLILKIDTKYYKIQVGQSMDEVLQKPLKDDQLRDLGIAVEQEKAAQGGVER